ncbi:DUF4838 domain-containing protein [Thalassobacterium sedimentorum]|uniref:DUF4838 domain-containing protein n=1 Tax=Thalassobacterium sedimentorum TaxID=3041258 RepID=UPI00281248E6|nr:DUF4838 domain-containing protein [Coraliomargarita sp. SDUM461004]
MAKFYRVLFCVVLVVFLGQFCTASQERRAQSWKPEYPLGSGRFTLAEIDTIVLPGPVTKPLKASLHDFQELLAASYGQSPQIVYEGRPKNALYLLLSEDGGQTGGAFSITRDRTRIMVRGADESAWRHALYAIMEDMLGARWYWADELGFEWAAVTRLFFPDRPWCEEPSFVQRRFHPVSTDFARRNRLNSIYSFNHNLARVFTQELFEQHPEVFAEVNGRRKAPRGHGGTDPQPDFTEHRAVELAAQAALSHFRAHPESTSFSLSINDNVLFDTGPATEASVRPLRYFRGRPNYTDLVFTFMNRVAELVFDEGGAWTSSKGEDRYLTALAYYWTEPAPSIPIHPRVMPVLTSDRAQWHDPAFRQQDRQLIRAWVDSGAERVATWDYYFGAPYPYPRQFNQWVGESLRFMADEGVDVFFSQLPAFWGLDGAKAWLGAKLLWDAQQEVGVLLDEYYERFFGVASMPMRAFYELAENYRNEHEGQAEWIKLYKDESSIALFSSQVLQQMRDQLSAAERILREAAPVSPPGRLDAGRFLARVKVVSEAFRLTELYAAFNQSRLALVSACLDAAPKARIEALLHAYRDADTAYRSYFEAYFDDASVYAPVRKHLELGQSSPERLARGVLEGAPEEFRSLSQDASLQHVGEELRNFLGPTLPEVEGWNFDYRASEHFKVEASHHASGRDAGLRVSGADIVSIFRTFPVVSNKSYALRLTGSWKVSLDNRVHLHVIWLDREGRTLQAEMPLRLPIEHRAEPVPIHLPFDAPSNAYDLRVRIVVSRQYPGDYLDLSELDFGLTW